MRTLAHVALALLSLFSVAAVFHRLAPYPKHDPFGVKMQFFADHKDDYDLLIIGSSRTQAGVMPRRIEAEMAERGVTIQAYNLATNAMRPHETDATLRKVLALRPARLRWVLAELTYWTGAINRRHEFSHRGFLWHDAPTTYAAMRSAYLYSSKPERKRERMLSHFLHFAGYATALGRGPEAAEALLRQENRKPRWLVKDQGYQEPAWGKRRDRESFFSFPCGARGESDQMKFYRRRVRKLSARNGAAKDLGEINVLAIERRSEMLQRAGIMPIHFLAPSLQATPHFYRLQEQGVLEHLLAFNDPKTYPELYALENRWDCDHLAKSGAELLSELLAEQLAEMIGEAPAG